MDFRAELGENKRHRHPVQTIAMTRFALSVGLIAGLVFCAGSACAEVSALGAWTFDTARKDVYVKSVRASQIDTVTMSEIAAQMGMARIENSIYEFSYERGSGPYLEVYDKTTRKSVKHPLKVQLRGRVLMMEKLENGEKMRMEPIDNDHMTLIDEAKKVRIPLKRI